MSQPEPGTGAVDKRKPRQRGKIKGRVVDLNALLEVQNLLGDAPRRRDLLIEHLHKIQDRYGHLSAAHLVALAHEMRGRQMTVAVLDFMQVFDQQIAPPRCVTEQGLHFEQRVEIDDPALDLAALTRLALVDRAGSGFRL